MKFCALTLLLLASVACLASHAEESNQKELDDSPTIIRENTIGRQLSNDDPEKLEIDNITDDTEEAAPEEEDGFNDHPESVNDEDDEESVNENASLQDDDLPNETTDSANDEEDEESVNKDASLQNDDLPNETTESTKDEEDEASVNEDASLQDDDLPNETTQVEDYSQDSAASEELDIQSDGYRNCSRVFRSNSGRFSSPGYPFAYPNNARCRWVIRPRYRGIIRITFDKFDVDRSSFFCRNDYVEVRGDGIRSQRYCGRKRPFTVVIRGYRASIMLRSDRRRTGRGFLAQYTVTPSSLTTRSPFHTRPRPTRPNGDLSRALLQVIKATRMQLEAVEKLVIIRSRNSRRNKYKREFFDRLRMEVTDAINKVETKADVFKRGPSPDAEKLSVDKEMSNLRKRGLFILNKLDNQ